MVVVVVVLVVVAATAWATEVVVFVAASGCHLSCTSLRFCRPRDVPQEQYGPLRGKAGVATSGRDPGVQPGQQGQLELALEGQLLQLLWLLGALSLARQPLGAL